MYMLDIIVKAGWGHLARGTVSLSRLIADMLVGDALREALVS